MNKVVTNEKELITLLDDLLSEKTSEWWSNFYKTKSDKIPFYCDKPDENLVDFCDLYGISPQKSLDIGCGIGRNTKYLSDISQMAYGCDISAVAIEEAKARCKNIKNLKFEYNSIFEHDLDKYDFIYDSGCLHHMPPHIRYKYLELVYSKLTSEGYFSLVCFNDNPGKGMSDLDVYSEKTMKGGMLYSKEKLSSILEPYFEILELREMKAEDDTELFGVNFNWAVLMKKKPSHNMTVSQD